MNTQGNQHRWLVVTAIGAVTAALIAFGIRRDAAPGVVTLTPQQEKIGGLKTPQYQDVAALTSRIKTGGASESDWNALAKVLRERSPVGSSLAIVSLSGLKSPVEQDRALTLIRDYTSATPPGEPVHQLVPLVLTQFIASGGGDKVRSLDTAGVDERLREVSRSLVKRGPA